MIVILNNLIKESTIVPLAIIFTTISIISLSISYFSSYCY